VQALPKYLRGHIFAINRARIERHLSQCVLCRSEYEGLRKAEETRRILEHINAPEGMIERIRAGVLTLGKLKKVIYRPLWIIGILLIVGAVYYYEVTPRQLDLEIERIVKTDPSSTMAGDNRILSAMSATAHAHPTMTPNQVATLPVTTQAPLVVIITSNNDTSAVGNINDILHGYGKMQNVKFSKTTKEISASLTARELGVLFKRIESIAKVNYSRQQFNKFQPTAQVPFVLRLKMEIKAAEDHVPQRETAIKPDEDHVPPRAEQTTPVVSVAPASSPAEKPMTPAAEVPTSSSADH
jgi:predicted anti-sigma-YlaC factor YlaD